MGSNDPDQDSDHDPMSDVPRERLPRAVSETAIVVVVPEAEVLLERYRRQRPDNDDPAIPAHVTVLFPFRPSIDADDVARIGAIASAVPSFDVTFGRPASFPVGLVYLAPDPVEPFLELTAALADAFPDTPPYGGLFDEIVPHLTVAAELDPTEVLALQEELAADAPIVARVGHLALLRHDDDEGWRAEHVWPLGPPADRAR